MKYTVLLLLLCSVLVSSKSEEFKSGLKKKDFQKVIDGKKLIYMY